MASKHFIFRVSIVFDASVFSARAVKFFYNYFNNIVDETIEDMRENNLSEGVEYEALLENNGISLYIAQADNEQDWDSDVLQGVVCEYFITLLVDTFMVLLPSNDQDTIRSLRLSTYEYMKNVTVTSSVNKERLLDVNTGRNDTYEVDALYVRDWVLNSLPLYSNLTVSNEDMEEEITDEVMFTTQTVQEYLQEDENNRILYTPVIRNGSVVKRSWSVLQKDFLDDFELLEGSKRYGCFVLDTMNPTNVDSENVLVDLQSFGSYNMWVPLTNVEDTLIEQEMIQPSSHPAFAVIPSFTKYASLVNVDVQDSGASAVSRYHCQDTGREFIKVHKIVPAYTDIVVSRQSCVTTDKTFRMSGDCKPGFRKDGDIDNCCKTENQDLLEQLVLLSSYRNVDFPQRLNYLREILSWYSSVRPIPSLWDTKITISVAETLPPDNEGILDVIKTLRPTITEAIISVIIDGNKNTIADKLRETIRLLNIENMHNLKITFRSGSKQPEISRVIFEETMGSGKYPMGVFGSIMTWSDDESANQILTVSKNLTEKERFNMTLHILAGFKRNRTLNPEIDFERIEAEDLEADAVMDSIQEKIEESFRKAGYKQKLVVSEDPDREEEPYRKEHVEVSAISFWKNARRDQRVMEIKFICKSKLPSPRKFKI